MTSGTPIIVAAVAAAGEGGTTRNRGIRTWDERVANGCEDSLRLHRLHTQSPHEEDSSPSRPRQGEFPGDIVAPPGRGEGIGIRGAVHVLRSGTVVSLTRRKFPRNGNYSIARLALAGR